MSAGSFWLQTLASQAHSPSRLNRGLDRCRGIHKCLSADHDSIRKLSRSRSASPSANCDSTLRCVSSHTGTADPSRSFPVTVRLNSRLRRSSRLGAILTSPRRWSGLSAAVSVVRSIASKAATEAIVGGSGRFSDINSENCPFVSPSGLSASSKRRASARAARCT